MKECRLSVYEPRRSELDSSKEVVGECKYKALFIQQTFVHPATCMHICTQFVKYQHNSSIFIVTISLKKFRRYNSD